ncbi:MAG: GTP-binding protein [Methanocellales archaeon]|nr:GTP-binding protein [Methanocellales archaeon]MDD3291063.1 GTP-binding protein [Methanocellales archaeon]MDD5234948.1 GTP-binding protein [Methanocellales archaeon]MDD5484682.1 GTP-binding protein [Methanocellales archaeon]
MDSKIEQKIKALEDEIFKTQKNKATEHHIGKLKSKIARLKEEAEKRQSKGPKGKGFSIKKSGDAVVGLVGFPNTGKSTLLNQLTGASSKIGDYDFTTLEAIPGVMKYKGADIQFLDLPGLITGASKGKGRGKEVLSAIRNVDLLLLMVDVRYLGHLEIIEKELYDAGLRLNQNSPGVFTTRKDSGGIKVNSTTALTHLNEDTIKSIASEFVTSADIIIREDISEDQLIDSFSKNRAYMQAVVVINKKDLVIKEILDENIKKIRAKGLDVLTISAKNGDGLDELREAIFSRLKIVRIYLKPSGGEADYDKPLILKEDDLVEDACKKLHRDFREKFRYALIWGSSAKHAGQKVGLDHTLKDEDVLTIIIWK